MLEPRVPSAGSISILRSSEALRVPCYVRAKVLAPFRPERSNSSRRDERPPRATPCRSRFASRLPSIARRRCLSPTSAIDSRHEHPRDRSISGPAACAALIAGFFPSPKVGFSRATPDRLAAIQPRLGARMTARLQLRPSRSRLRLAFRLGGCRGSPMRRSHSGLALSATHRAGDRTSDAPCRAPRDPRCWPGVREEPGSLPPPPRQKGQLSRPRAPSLDKCSQDDRSRDPSVLREPATDLAVLPPAIRLPTLFCASSALAQRS
jgi:hypothetical protein